MLSFRSLTVRLSTLLFLAVAFTLNAAPSLAQKRSAPKSPASPKIRLVLGITIDQFREDYLDRFGDLYGEGGFKRLIKGGALFANAHYLHACTYTAPGHGVILTGSVAAQTGIIGNSWYDRESGRNIESITDPKYVGVPSGKGSAPTRLLVTTLGDQMKMATGGQSRVIGVSLKDRSAILPAGRNADAAYWFDSKSGAMQTSTYYMEKLPAWVEAFNARKIPDGWFGKSWEKILPEAAYARSDRDDAPYEGRFAGGGQTFPHIIGVGAKPDVRFYEDFTKTPWSNDMLVDFAAAALENERLGADDAPDVLSVSFSANDILGHAFGPFSQEMEDMTVRTDRSIARLLDIVDKRVGLANTLVFLTADHGVAPIPEYSQTRRLGGRRISEKAILDAVYKALVKEYGEGEWIVGASADSLYLNLETIQAKKLDRDDVECTAGEAALTVPGVATYFTRTQLLNGPLPPTDIARRVVMAFNPQRSGDVYLVPEPFAFFSEGISAGTTHGTPYPYDTHVPVLLMGRGVRPGKYLSEASPSDIAPTLAALLGVAAPSGTVGKILREAVEK
jgi:predicted AlkP superfamily pyrophosphatase or phosphodiesterase